MNLAARLPLLYTIPAGSESWLHAHKLCNLPPFFGKSQSNRFDDPKQLYGTFYIAETHECVFLEIRKVQAPRRTAAAAHAEIEIGIRLHAMIIEVDDLRQGREPAVVHVRPS